MASTRKRRATHAGSWYDSSGERLNRTMSRWLSDSRRANQNSNVPPPNTAVHAIIAPHAGYSFSGVTAAHAYATIDAQKFSRVIVLGPSHHVYMKDKCAVTDTEVLETPLGNLRVDSDVIRELFHLNAVDFIRMDTDMDEAEHSIEMHLPFIKKIYDKNAQLKIIPIVVGSLSRHKEKEFGKLLSTWLGDGETFFIISTDFCHWGTRFRYTKLFNFQQQYHNADAGNTIHKNGYRGDGAPAPAPPLPPPGAVVPPGYADCYGAREDVPIWKSIQHLDHQAMSIIESGNHSEFCNYEHETENTICGRHCIGILMSALAYCEAQCEKRFTTTFVHYAQSSKCLKMSDSSVSYASAVVYTSDDAPAPASKPSNSSIYHQQQQQQQQQQRQEEQQQNHNHTRPM